MNKQTTEKITKQLFEELGYTFVETQGGYTITDSSRIGVKTFFNDIYSACSYANDLKLEIKTALLNYCDYMTSYYAEDEEYVLTDDLEHIQIWKNNNLFMIADLDKFKREEITLCSQNDYQNIELDWYL